MIKLVVFLAAVTSTVTALSTASLASLAQGYRPLPSPSQPGRLFAIIRSVSDSNPDGSYHYEYETENGISAQESGTLTGSGPDAAVSATGGFQYTSPEGVPVQVSYAAGPDGFQPNGNVLPTPPPTPEAILKALAYIAAHPEPQTASPVYRQNYYKK